MLNVEYKTLGQVRQMWILTFDSAITLLTLVLENNSSSFEESSDKRFECQQV